MSSFPKLVKEDVGAQGQRGRQERPEAGAVERERVALEDPRAAQLPGGVLGVVQGVEQVGVALVPRLLAHAQALGDHALKPRRHVWVQLGERLWLAVVRDLEALDRA